MLGIKLKTMWTWILLAILIILAIIIGIVEYYGSVTAAWTALTHRAHAATGGTTAHHISWPGIIGSIVVAGILMLLLTTNPGGLFGDFGEWCKNHSRIILTILMVGLAMALYHFTHHNPVIKGFGIVFCTIFAIAMISFFLKEREKDPKRIAENAAKEAEEKRNGKSSFWNWRRDNQVQIVQRELTEEEKFTTRWYSDARNNWATLGEAQSFMDSITEVVVSPNGFAQLPAKPAMTARFAFDPNGSPALDITPCDANGTPIDKELIYPSQYFKETYVKNNTNEFRKLVIYHWKVKKEPITQYARL